MRECFVGCVLITFSILFTTILFGEDDANKKSTSKEENKPESVIKDIEIVGVLSKISSSKDLPPGSKEKTSWYVVQIKGGYLIPLPEKIEDKEIDFKQYEGKEVTVKGKGTEEVSKFEGMKNIEWRRGPIPEKGLKLPNFVSLISINIKATDSNKDQKSSEKKKDDSKKDPGNVPLN